jgi:hypothetical protein
MVHRLLVRISALTCILLMVACTTIIKGTEQNIAFSSNPSGASVSIYDSDGARIAEGTTPITIPLKKGAGYFKAAKYRVVFEASGMKSKEVWITGSMETGWYILGNLLVGGLLGWLIVDPASGAMWNLSPERVDASLAMSMKGSGSGLTVILAAQVPAVLMATARPIEAAASAN